MSAINLSDFSGPCEEMIMMNIRCADLRIESTKGDLCLVGKAVYHAQLTNISFNQLCLIGRSPEDYLRTLSPTLIAQNINHGLKQRHSKDTMQLLLCFDHSAVLLYKTFLGKNRHNPVLLRDEPRGGIPL